ncbi:unnamed protein product [Linum tenue]|uniref:Uncharacterized protein n=1 Tax=Linum tenue TaxID=586396 RepID=A0AAV0GRA0_9ROSI|nr:unnamed protein product [Linum tenue]
MCSVQALEAEMHAGMRIRTPLSTRPAT